MSSNRGCESNPFYTWALTDKVHQAFAEHMFKRSQIEKQCALTASCADQYNGYFYDLDDVASTNCDELSELDDLEVDEPCSHNGIPMMPVVDVDATPQQHRS